MALNTAAPDARAPRGAEPRHVHSALGVPEH